MDPGGTDKQGGLPSEEDVIKKGYMKKLKTMKKKFFVLRGDTLEKSACLEYYDTEKKWKTNSAPKKSILLKNCFNITRRLDLRQKHVIALYTRKECHCVVAESEEELAEWLAALLELLHPKDALLNTPQPSQRIWQVNIQKKGLGASRNIVGNYTLRLTDKSLILSKMRAFSKGAAHQSVPTDHIEYSLSSIRRCGDSESFFYMEVGRSSVTGAGELWMHTEDPNIAKSMHTTVLIAMSSSMNNKDELDPKSRLRSASATEASKPISVLTRRQTHQGTKSHGLSPSSESTLCSGRSCVGLCISPCENQSAAYCAPQSAQDSQEVIPLTTQPPVGSGHGILVSDGNVRERCDSLPSRGNTPSLGVGGIGLPQAPSHPSGMAHRPHSMYIRGISHSPPANSPLSPHSVGAYSTDSAGSSVSIDETDNFSHHPLIVDDPSHLNHRLINSRTPDETIFEEGSNLSMWQPEKYLPKGATSYGRLPLHKGAAAKDVHSVRKSSIGVMSEVGSPVLVPNSGTSPQDQSGYMPMSPASAEPVRLVHSRVGGNSSNHSRTSSLAEDIPDTDIKTEEGYVDMEPNKDGALHAMSPAASVSSVTSGTPSTDIRFSEFHLDKVSSYFGPEEDGCSRPLRAYSVGSRPDHVKKVINRHDVQSSVADSSRTRAFSCGSKSRNSRDNRILNHGTPPHSYLLHLTSNANAGTKSSSTPILGAGGSLYRHTYNSSHSSVEPLDDLMEMDFSNRTDSSSSVKTQVPPVTSLPPLPTSTNTDGYMDMAPVSLMSGYVEMKPADSCPSSDATVTPKMLSEAVRKISITKPHHHESNEKVQGAASHSTQPSNADGYVEMSWNNGKGTCDKPRSRVPSLPITIMNSNNPKEIKSQSACNASPIFSMASMLISGDGERGDGTSPKMSPATSPAAGLSFSPLPSHKKSKKHQPRRNSTELSTPTSGQPQTIFPFSPGSPVKFNPIKGPNYNPEGVPDAGGGDTSSNIPERPFDVSAYMEMAPIRLSTVKEINESCGTKSPVDKTLKQIMNNATKVSSDYKASVCTKVPQLMQQKSIDETISRAKPTNGSQTSASHIPKNKYMSIKTFSPTTCVSSLQMDPNSKENQDILSSNPTANRTLTSNSLVKANINQIQPVKKPVLVISQTSAIMADFKPIPAYEIEQKKSGSPKQCESALNRQLAYFDNKSRGMKEDPCDGYEWLLSQNGQFQKTSSSRPASVNNNKGKKEGGSGSRPASVNSESSIAKQSSRPSSVSSEIGGTPCGSRPGSVTGEREKLHYASLDLNPPSSMSPMQPPIGGLYSTIDFVKCEELKNTKNLAAKSSN